MTKKLLGFLFKRSAPRAGSLLAVATFVVFMALMAVAWFLPGVVGRLGLIFNSDATNAAKTCVSLIDFNSGNNFDYYANCTAGQYLQFNRAQCVNDATGDAVRTVGDNCSCAALYYGYNASTNRNEIYAVGRCGAQNAATFDRSTAVNFTEADIFASLATSTPGCTPDCTGTFGCCDGCGGICSSGLGACSPTPGSCDAGTCTCS